MGLAGQAHGQGDVLIGQVLKEASVGNRGFQSGGLCGGNAPGVVGAVFPGLMLVVRAGLLAAGVGPVLGLETAQFHGGDGGHLLEELSALREEIGRHESNMASG